MATQINVDTITNTMIPKKLGLSSIGQRHFEIPPARVLERYFGEYSILAKAYRTRDVPDPSVHEVAMFELEVGCVHINV